MVRVQMLSQQPAVKDSIQIPIYNHKSKQTRTEEWRHYESTLQTYLGAKHGVLGGVLISPIDLNDDWWGLEDDINNLLDDETITQDTWVKAQYSLVHALNMSFHTTDFRITQKYSVGLKCAAAQEWLTAHTLNEQSDQSRWYPFGSICFHELRAVYNQGGGTDAIVNTMQLETVTQAFLNQQNDASFDKWFSNMSDAWSIVHDLISKHDPSFLAALQLLQVVKQHSNPEWTNWGTQFLYDHRRSSFTMQKLLDELKSQSKQVHLSSKTKVHSARAHLTAAGGTSPGGRQKKKCTVSGCTNFTSRSYHKHCTKCHVKKAADVTDNVAQEVADKRSKNLKKKFARRREKAKANHVLADDNVATEDDAQSQAGESEAEVEQQPVAAIAAAPKRKRVGTTKVGVKKQKTSASSRASVSSAIAHHQLSDSIQPRIHGIEQGTFEVLDPPQVSLARARSSGACKISSPVKLSKKK